MARKTFLFLSVIGLLFGAGVGMAQAQRAIAVSPGATKGVARIAQSCPTFSWGAVEGAARYELVVYELAGEQEEGEEKAPLIRVRLPGSALSWTPSLERCLEPGGQYVWSVRGRDEFGEGEWSSGRYFEVVAGPSTVEVEEALTVLRRYLGWEPEEAAGAEAVAGEEAVLEGIEERPAAAGKLRERFERARRRKEGFGRGFAPLSSDTVGATSSPQTVTPPASYSLTIDGDFALGGFVFKEGYPFLHNDGGYGAFNTALGLNALVSSTPGIPYGYSGKNNTALGASALQNNTTGSYNTASGARALQFNTTGSRNTASGDSALYNNTTGSSNTASGDAALWSNTTGFNNTASGSFALQNNTTGSRNTASGNLALWSNTTGSFNTASGKSTLYSNTTGSYNTASGVYALRSNTGSYNTASGYKALLSNTTGSRNTASGHVALVFNTTGSYNTASGVAALNSNITGSNNTASGDNALLYTTGSRNTGVGRNAGLYATDGSDNIFLGFGAFGVAAEANTIRIGGTTVGTGTGQQNRTFINGIRGVTTGNANAIAVLIDSAGQLGTVSSSRRFKKEIEDMAEASENLLDLRPVTFKYKQEPVEGSQPLEFGLIAEEVAEVFPDLVVYDDEGKPYTVRYHLLSSMLLNELQKQQRQLDNQKEQLEAQDQLKRDLLQLRGRLARLEAVEAKPPPIPGSQRPPPAPDRGGAP